ncbi:hypothetical protein BJB45_03280 [Halomonas huangheensis]|uniref:Uncharacterized protein n=1 Tax=Halomonas huangheensis TaxID=1178482 RepID=W1N3M5_9GAMM|nr:hypothetical protein AR456_04765 [Halomonas huangheensis]ERL50162.1 hypothetical protein BJB45_03280 [Halomonas huangheensis]
MRITIIAHAYLIQMYGQHALSDYRNVGTLGQVQVMNLMQIRLFTEIESVADLPPPRAEAVPMIERNYL